MRLASAAAAAALAALAVTLAACGGDDAPSCLPGCPGERGYDVLSYHLDARFDWGTNTLYGTEDIRVSPTYPVIELDADVDIASIHNGDIKLTFVHDRDTAKLRVDLTPVVGDATPLEFTVEYTAQLSDALVLAGPRDDDPVASRVVYTDSEPDRGVRWLVAKHDPSDRALWSVDVTAPADHAVIANGEVRADTPNGITHVVSYALDQPIPTYLMAFAEGELTHVERSEGRRVPLSVWFRTGLALDPDDTLDAVADAMATFEQLVGPYPWDSYAVVLLPGFGGGMENATITFNDESSGQGAVSFSLNAHELAHHWFGDWVTMRHYDDVWVKEGMATFLAAEATRATRDFEDTGRYFANDFGFYFGDKIVDTSLKGFDKYTSGPYQRAAWLITQVRALVGEDAFWAGLRKVLADHAVGDVDGAEFLAAFGLPAATQQRLFDSLSVDGAPQIDVSASTAAGVTTATLTLTDPSNTLAAPLDVVVVDAAGVATTTTLQLSVPASITIPDGGYLVPDPRNLHPLLQSFFLGDGFADELRARMVPTAGPALTDFLHRSPSHQEVAFNSRVTMPIAADEPAVNGALDSLPARRSHVLAVCTQHRTATGADATALADFLELAIWNAPIRRYGRYAACAPAVAEAALGRELQTIGFVASAVDSIEYMIGFDYGPATSLARVRTYATTAPSVRMRDLAIDRLLNQTYRSLGYTQIPPAEVPQWTAFFRERLPLTTSFRRLAALWTAELNLGDTAALPLLAPLLHTVPMAESDQLDLVCQAHQIASAEEWAAFQSATQPWSSLSAAAAAALADPATCGNKPARARPSTDAVDHVQHLRSR